MINNKASLLRIQSRVYPASLLQGAFTVFEIFNGPIEVRSLGLKIETAIAAGTYPVLFQFTPLGGSALTLCAADTAIGELLVGGIGGATAEQTFFVDGVKTTALVKSTDVGIGPGNVLHMPMILSEGTIALNCVGLLSNPNLAISTTPFAKVANSAFTFNVAGTTVSKAAVPAGTALPAATIPQNKYGLYALTIVAGGTITVTGAAGNAAGTYTTEAAAIAALPATAAASVLMGYITVVSTDAGGFVGATTALNDAAVTAAYYNVYNPPASGAIKAFMSWYPLSMDARVVSS
jgi:hypothetical protein